MRWRVRGDGVSICGAVRVRQSPLSSVHRTTEYPKDCAIFNVVPCSGRAVAASACARPDRRQRPEHVAPLREFPSYLGVRLQVEVGMRVRVIGDLVAVRFDPPGDLRPLFGILPMRKNVAGTCASRSTSSSIGVKIG